MLPPFKRDYLESKKGSQIGGFDSEVVRLSEVRFLLDCGRSKGCHQPGRCGGSVERAIVGRECVATTHEIETLRCSYLLKMTS